ncbi:pyridine nucleotide-disulfide oxidoreductase domain-containing protein [Acrasis kona]|uniref:Pyridine nucleotide-disulfide oxidoreductase domain-containing protein 2 n=1 Tax=Acrasis kona TaxID=1008807 RepID=A0AAW2ZLD7_9EUKA
MFTPMMRVVPLLSRRYSTKIKSASYDAIIIGGGHNGLVCSAYLKKNRPNWNVLVVERRHLIGGAAVTEEIVPGFKFSRASYLCSLFRPQILDDLKIRDKITLIGRNPSSFTPMLDGRHLFMGPDHSFNYEQVSKFSKKDADNLKPYEDMLNHYAASFEQLLDLPPFDPTSVSKGLMKGLSEQSDSIKLLMREVGKIGPSNIPEFAELLTAPASKLLRRYFESEPLISTLATDAIIGAFASPSSPGSAYVLLHHVMGDVGFGRGVWAYVKGGMGALSDAIADAARGYGVEIVTDVGVSSITTKNNKASGVILSDGTEISASKCVISNLNAYTTCNDLLSEQDKQNLMPESFMNNVRNIDFESATFKINLAVDRIPQFKCMKKMEASQHHGPEHVGTIHIGENSQQVEDAYNYARAHSEPSKVPIIEMTIPSSLDHTLAPEGKHVVQLFIQYAPYTLSKGTWDDPGRREAFANSVYDTIEQYAPGFKSSIIGQDLLSPLDLERVFGLKGGNIFHGSVGLDQLYFNRPVTGGYSRHAMPVDGLYLAGSAAHPGGGVMGAPGRNCSMVVLNKYK